MKKIIPFLTLIIISNSNAEYSFKKFIEEDKGGFLPKNSIKINNQLETWQSIEPLYSEWNFSGEPYDCISWYPENNTVFSGENFTQTSNDCKQLEERTVQNREQNNKTLQIRNTGDSFIENRVANNITNSRNAIGTAKECRTYTSSNYWLYSPSRITIRWNNINVIGNLPINNTEYIKDGYLYTSAQDVPYVVEGSNFEYYGVCRVLITP